MYIAWVSGLPKGLGERRFEMGEGGGEALSFFRFHLSPFPQKRLILRLQCTGRSLHHPSLRSKRFPVRSSRKLGREQKRRMREKGKQREGKVSSFPFSLPLHMFFCSRSTFREITQLQESIKFNWKRRLRSPTQVSCSSVRESLVQ